MKKRNLLTLVLTLTLVATLAVGATLAYLTSTDNDVVNTFTFAEGMVVKLWENKPDKDPTTKDVYEPFADETWKENGNKGYDYSNVVAGQKLSKRPALSTTTAVDAYVFVRVSGFDVATMTCDDMNTDWIPLTGIEEVNGIKTGDGVYYQKVDGKAGTRDLGELFTTVTIASNLAGVDENGSRALPDIKIEVYEIQASTFGDDVNAAYAAFTWPADETTGA